MNSRSFLAVIFLLTFFTLIISIFPVNAWNYTDTGAEDTMYEYEEFGPRADRLLIELFADAEAEWDALEAGDIDITDWSLTEPYYDRFTTPPQNESIETKYYGAEFGMFLLDINHNNNPFLGNPQDPAYPNPVYPNNPTSCVNMRQAIWHLTDRDTWGDTYIGEGFYFPLISTHPPSFGAYSKPMANPYPYSPAAAIAKLESDVCPADGAPDFPLDDGTGYRYHDLDGDGVYDDPEERVEIIFAIRSDHYHRNAWGDALTAEMEAINIRVDARYGAPTEVYYWWYYDKEVHLYTAGWSLGVDPDHVVLWHSDYYWHPGFSYNTGYINDPILDDAADHVWSPNTLDEALTYCYIFQDRFAEIVAAVPFWSYAGSKAVRRRYTGGTNEVLQGDGEDPYRGRYWDGIVNKPGYGCDDYFSFLNMHPRGFDRGSDSEMTIRHSFKVAELNSFNPVYAEWLWDWNVLGLVYDSLLYRNPYNLADIKPSIAENYEVGLYDHLVYGSCTKVKFTLRPDVYWADGTLLTAADVHFTFVELEDILIGRGLSPPWWYSNVHSIWSFNILDPYTFEVLLDLKSVYEVMQLGGNVILPKHVWKPIAETGEPDNPTADPDMIGCGPWRFKEYVGYSHVLLVANKPGSTVQTSHTGSTPITSTEGYFRYTPLAVRIYGDNYGAKFDPFSNVNISIEFENLWAGGNVSFDEYFFVDNALQPGYPYAWQLNPLTSAVRNLTLSFPKGKHTLKVIANVSSPSWIKDQLVNVTLTLWITLDEDIVGSHYVDPDLVAPDIMVDVKDLARACRAFGSYAGFSGWDSLADINRDYQIDIRDIAKIAQRFGWSV